MKPIRITAKSKEHARAIWTALESQGFKNANGRSFDQFEERYPWRKGDTYGVDDDGDLDAWGCEGCDNNPTHASIDDAILSLPKIRTLKLNDNYTAIVTAESVEVGCQTFTHDIIHDLSRLCREIMAD